MQAQIGAMAIWGKTQRAGEFFRAPMGRMLRSTARAGPGRFTANRSMGRLLPSGSGAEWFMPERRFPW